MWEAEMEYKRVPINNELFKRLNEFSDRGIRKDPNKDLPLVGLGCALHTWPIVEKLTTVWFGDKDVLSGITKARWDLGMVVGTAVFTNTRDHFPWTTVCEIVELSGTHKFNESIIHHFTHMYPGGVAQFSAPVGARTTKNIVRDLAKTALWAEALSFLDNEGYAERLVQRVRLKETPSI